MEIWPNLSADVGVAAIILVMQKLKHLHTEAQRFCAAQGKFIPYIRRFPPNGEKSWQQEVLKPHDLQPNDPTTLPTYHHWKQL